MVHSDQVSMMKDHKEKKQGHHNPVNQKGLFLGVGSEEPHFHGPSPFFSDTALLLRNNFHWVLFRGSTKQPDISRPNNAPVYIIVSTLVEINNFWTKRKN